MRHWKFRRAVLAAASTAALTAWLTTSATLGAVEPLPQDRGAAGTWQKLLKLRTIASVMHTTAHPDDEHGGVLALLSRGGGARVTLLTLTRGESGDNAIGPELFDALGLIRTEELLRADQYYGVDQQYFTTVVDYGFSKRLEEALVMWGRENVLRDVVRIIRTERPLVIISRFQGNERDGHGNHQAAGVITQDAFKVAGDPAVFPDQIKEGLRPWQPLKLYMGGVRENEDWTIGVDPAVYSPWLGETYASFARIGLSFQRSQNGGRNDPVVGPAYSYYKRLASQTAPEAGGAKETTFFDGIDTRLSALFATLRHPEPPGAAARLQTIEREVDAAIQAFRMDEPSASVPSLARGLAATRLAVQEFSTDPDAVQILRVKEQQFTDAINAAMGIEFTAIAQAANVPDASGPSAAFAPPPTMDPVVPGQTVVVKTRFTQRGPAGVIVSTSASMSAGQAGTGQGAGSSQMLEPNQTRSETFQFTVPPGAPSTRPFFTRRSIADNRYTVTEPGYLWQPGLTSFSASGSYMVGGVSVRVTAPVTRREARLPYGYVMRELAIVPTVAVNVSPQQAIVPLGSPNATVRLDVELMNNAAGGATGQLALRLPPRWTAKPSAIPFTFARPGEKTRHQFTVSVPDLENREYSIDAVATVNGQEFKEGYDVIEHRDLETRYLYHAASTHVRGVDVKVTPGLKVGYVMGVGDEVPSGIAQLGAQVRLLDERDLAASDLRQYDAIVTGTRAYAVRHDLRTYNRRLLDYAKDGGNLIVLYNTPAEFDPNTYSPYPAQLPRNAEEVSEEDSPVRILAAARPEFSTPNAITAADFDGWVEQRGSKFFSEWDRAYTPMIETYDQGQPPQRGGWLTASYGKGHYTYFAYAFHRQLPYGVPGAYRLLANLLSLGKSAR